VKSRGMASYLGMFIDCWSKVILCGVTLVTLLTGCAVRRTVEINSSPTGANVFVNGEQKGQTPISVNLKWEKKDGTYTSHVVTVNAYNYDAEEKRLSYWDAVGSGNPWEHTFTLEPLTQTVNVRFESVPPGATVSLGNKTSKTPTTIAVGFSRSASQSPWSTMKAVFDLADYELKTMEVSYERVASQPNVTARLEPLVQTVNVHFESTPPRATVNIADKQAKTPATIPIQFTRSSSQSPWALVEAAFELADYESKTMDVRYEQVLQDPKVNAVLDELRRGVPVDITSNVEAASVKVDNIQVGKTPLRHVFVFERPNSKATWNTFSLAVEKEGYRYHPPGKQLEPGSTQQYQATLTIDEAARQKIHVPLELIKFYWTTVRKWDVSKEALRVVDELVLSQVGEIEKEPKVHSVTRITDATREDKLAMTKISVMPDNVGLVYSYPLMVEGSFANIRLQKGNELTRLTDGLQNDLYSCVSSDGEWVYLTSDRLSRSKLNIWRIKSMGKGGLTKITDSPSSTADYWPALSPDGSKLAYTSMLTGAENPQVWVSNADGTLPTQLRIGKNPSWSPDGSKLVFVVPETPGKESNPDKPAWKIWVMGADGSNPTKLTTGKHQDDFPVWTPDGRKIIFASDEAINEEGKSNWDIWIMNENGTNKTQLTVNGSLDSYPAISPDGKYVYFFSNRGARREGQPATQIWRIRL